MTGRISLSRRQKEALEEASRDRRSFARACEPEFAVAGRAMTHLADECAYKGEDGIATLLTAKVLGRLPDSFEQEPCSVVWRVRGENLPGFEGKVVSLTRKGRFTEIVAATAGYEADRTPLGEGPADDREWVGLRPDTALYDATSVLPYRDYALGPFPEPPLYRRGTDRFSWVQYAKAAISEVEDKARLKAADLPTNVASAYPLAALSRSEAAVWAVEEGLDADEVEDGSADGERYARVLAHREGADGVDRPLAEARVDNGARRVFPRSALVLPFGEGADASSGYALAYAEAARLGADDREVSADLAYPPFMLARGDVFSAVGREHVEDGVVLSTFLARLGAVAVDVLNRRGSVSGRGFLLRTEKARSARKRLGAELAGGFVRPLWGLDADGVPGFDASLPWVRDAGDYVEIDRALAAVYGVTITDEPDAVGVRSTGG